MASPIVAKRMTLQAALPQTEVGAGIPALACDCHTHVIGPYGRFPLWPGRSYTPPEASLQDHLRVQAALGVDRVVVVQPSVNGTDNSVTLDAVRRFGSRARGIAVIDPDADEQTLAELDAGGMRGVRVNFMTVDEPAPQAARDTLTLLAAKLRPQGWHLQLYARLPLIFALRDTLAALPVPVVLDHFGGVRAADGLDQAGFAELCELVRGGNVNVKLSAAYRISDEGAEDPAVADVARRLIEAGPANMVWGSDWPHPGAFVGKRGSTDVAPFHDIDDGTAMNSLVAWAGDADTLRRILVDNPRRLYGFE